MSLGIIDWGIGGVSIYKLIKERRPDVPVVYFSDTGVTPYGKMSRDELVGRLNSVIEFLRSRGVSHLAVGCNAASTAIDHLDTGRIKVEGVIKSAVEQTSRLKPRRLGLIGGRRTVVSGLYRTAFAQRGIRVEQRIAQPLSGLIESGDVGSDKLKAECRRILGPLRNCSHVLLACTHYPAISNILERHVSPETELIDPARGLADKIMGWNIEPGGTDLFLTSGDPAAMKKAALAAFGCTIDRPRQVTL